MWLLGLVTVYGPVHDREAFGSAIAMAAGIVDVLIITGAPYTVYDGND